MLNNKRAQIFDISMIFVVLGAMIAVLLVVNAVSTETSPWKTIGQRAFELQRAYGEGDAFAHFMTTAARWTAAPAVLDLGARGGFSTNPSSGCGSLSNGFALWNNPDKPIEFCYPNAYDAFYAVLRQRLPEYTTLYLQSIAERLAAEHNIRFPAQYFVIPYEFLITNNRLLGIATAPVLITMYSPEEKFVYYAPGAWLPFHSKEYRFGPAAIGTYSFRPNFEISLNYNFEIYKILSDVAQKVVQDCAALAADDEKKTCSKTRFETALVSLQETATIDVGADQDVYYFTITQNGRKGIYYNNAAPIIKFALVLKP